MKMSELFGQTLRKAPAGVQSEGLALLIRGGFLRQSGAGVFSYLPLGTRVIGKMRKLIAEELAGQEVLLPWAVQAGERSTAAAGSGGGSVPSGAMEQQVADLALGEIGSFRQLPRFIFHFRPVWDDKDLPAAGAVRFRERLMFFGYALAEGDPQLAERHEGHWKRLEQVLARCRVPAAIADADPAAGGGRPLAHQLVCSSQQGDPVFLSCSGCGYLAHQEAAVFRRDPKSSETAGVVEKVATPDATTMRALAEQLQVPLSKTAKAVFLTAAVAGSRDGGREIFVVAVLRGDMDLNEAKLSAALNAASLRPAVEEEIRRWGIEPGYGSPVGVRGIRLVVDEAIPNCVNLVAGANEAGHHLLNVNYGRDFQGGEVADIALAGEGAPCLRCGKPLSLVRGTVVAAGSGRDNRVCERVGATFQDHQGRNRPVRLGLYSLDLGRLLVCAAEHHHDDNGLKWPAAITPYDLHIVKLTKDEEAVQRVYQQLREAGFEVLYDDREESAGVKFNDADLIGVPIRLTIGDRSLQAGGVELKPRGEVEKTLVPLADLTAAIEERIHRR